MFRFVTRMEVVVSDGAHNIYNRCDIRERLTKG